MSQKLVIMLCLIVVLLTGNCTTEKEHGVPAVYSYSIPDQTGDGWESASLESVGIDQSLMTDLINHILGGTYSDVHSVLLIKDGKLVFEEYFNGFDRDTLHPIYSCTKSVDSALVGIAIDKGFLSGVDEKIYGYFPQHSYIFDNDDVKKSISLRHVLTMSAGFEWDERTFPYNSSQNDASLMMMNSDPMGFLFSRPLSHASGEWFEYNSGLCTMVVELLRRATGERADDFAEKYLFDPLGITDYDWWVNKGYVDGGGGLKLRPRDMAKFGFLHLNKGMWKGIRILSEKWVDVSTAEKIDGEFDYPYGYYWWLDTMDVAGTKISCYFAAGLYEQKIFVFPPLDLVVVFTHGNERNPENSISMLNWFILPAALN